MPNTKTKLYGITQEEAEVILFKSDSEGLGYALDNGYLDLPMADSEYKKALEKAKEAYVVLEKMLEEIRKHFAIEFS